MSLLEEKPEIVSHIKKILTVLSIRCSLESTPFYLTLNRVKKQLSSILKINIFELPEQDKKDLNFLIHALVDEIH